MEYHPREIKGIIGGTDEIGVTSYQVPFYAKSIEECTTVGRGYKVNGLPEKSRTWAPGDGGIFVVTILFQGQSDPADSPKASEVQIGVRPSYHEEPIEMHPDIIEIMEKYSGAKDASGRIVFDPYYTPGKDGARGLPGNSQDKTSKRNPFFGVEKFMKLDVTVTRTYAAKAIPGDLLSRIGKVVSAPPGAPSGYANRRKWLVMPPTANQRGNVAEVTEEYLLLDDDTAPELYKNA